ncbi:MAG: hypothetical protein P4L90_02905 [Rhodopila sp.]|nr:hypothetical protein [Rhodopila sp.]
MNATKILSLAAAAGMCALLPSGVASAQTQAQTPPQTPPPWAYPFLDPSVQPPPDDGIKRTIPGSSASFTLTDISDVFNVHDWFPDDHPPMPQVVAHGRPPEVRACGVCHLPNGQGRPENAGLAGLPVSYIVQQVADIKSGRRRSSVPEAGPQLRMLASATHATDEEIQAAARYFSQQTYRPWIRVVETEMVPKTEVIVGTVWAPSPGTSMEPIGRRIVEIPEDLGRAELHDPRIGFVAYVPVGSIKRGETLATTGDSGRTVPCNTCHGPRMNGLAEVPPIAGRSTSYIIRQLYDIQSGTRTGAGAELMKPVVAKLTMDDMIALAAFVASRTP